MNARQWLDAFAAELGTDPPTNDEVEAILDVGAGAGHPPQRLAAPGGCWVGGRAGASLADLHAAAERVSEAPGSAD